MQKTKYINLALIITLSMTLFACEGENTGGSGSHNNDDPGTVVKLAPLNISITAHPVTNDGSISSKEIDYIDMSKLGSHPTYKLTLTNPNKVAVTRPRDFSMDDAWTMYQASPDKKRMPTNAELEEYYAKHNPLFWEYYIKNSNSDDCLKIETIPAGGSCSFYQMASWRPIIKTTESEFTYPLSYTISQADKPDNYLYVGQCSYLRDSDPVFSCGNMKKPEYKNQFIKYRITPFKRYDIKGDGWRGGMAVSGKVGYIDDYSSHTIKVSIAQVSYEDNVVKYVNPVLKYSLPDNVHEGVVSYNGDSQWAQVLYNANFMIYNSEGKFYEFPNWWEVDPATVTTQELMVAGYDNSIWVNVFSSKKIYPAVVYDAGQDKFVETNINRDIQGVDANHVVLTMNDAGTNPAQFACWFKIGDYQYKEQPLQNYIGKVPRDDRTFDSYRLKVFNNLYIPMYIPGLYDIDGKSISWIVGWYKLHTKDKAGNDACYIDLDDYMSNFSGTITPQFALMSGIGSIPLENVYLGK